MNDKAWFLHVAGEALGPFSTAQMVKLLHQNRCNDGDFVWCEGMADWARILDCEIFAGAIQAHPRIAPPTGGARVTPIRSEAPKARPAAPAKRAPEPEPETETESETRTEIAAPVRAAKPVETKPAKATKPAPAPAPAPAPEPELPTRREIRDATFKTSGLSLKVYEVSETGAVFERSPKIEVGADLKLKLESATLGKPMDLTGVVHEETQFNGKPALTIDFTRMNPAHRRTLATYITGGAKKAA